MTRSVAFCAAMALAMTVASAAEVAPLHPRDADEAVDAGPAEPARVLPPTVPVCVDAATRRCWIGVRGGGCEPGRVLRVVIEGPDAEVARAACERELGVVH